jgi:hypothetical protein
MKRFVPPWHLWLFLTLLLVAASFLLPAVHWRVIGWVRGEAFYQGRPTSYWKREILRYDEAIRGLFDGNRFNTPPPLWIDTLKSRLEIDPFKRPEILEGTSDAVPVMVELVKDDEQGLFWAADALKHLDPQAAIKAGIK